MKAIRTILACLRKADQMFNLIEDGDKIALGISGGKDSLVLLQSMDLYRKFSHKNFVIVPITLDLGFPNFDPEKISDYCATLGLELIVNDSKDVYKILSIQQEKMALKHLPCSICSRMKKAAINKVAKEQGCNKVAFAHHADDAIETLFMNQIFGARVATFSPMMKLSNAEITFIRPLVLCRESDIEKMVKEENLPVVPSSCPADKNTTREKVKGILKQIYTEFPSANENFLSMLTNYEKSSLWGDEIALQIDQKGLFLKPVVTPKDEAIALDIRHEVFMKEFGVTHEEEFEFPDEFLANQFLICKNDVPIGTIRYIEREDGIQLQRFSILKSHRGKGYGREVLMYLDKMLTDKYNPTTLFFNAMIDKKKFYESCGYTAVGEVFTEGGNDHIKMIKIV